MKRGSDRFWADFSVRKAEATKEFELKIGYCTSFSAYHARVRELFLAMLLQRKPLGVNKMLVQFGGNALSLRIVPPRAGKMGIFGAYGDGVQQHVAVALGPDSLGLSVIHTIEWEIVEQALTDLLVSGQVSLDDVWFFTGTSWQPPRPSEIAKIADSTAA